MMSKDSSAKRYDLEERTVIFAKEVRMFVKSLKMNLSNVEDAKQLIRSSGSVGANYIEANDALSKKDFLMHIKISRKESKESAFWLGLMDEQSELSNKKTNLIQEANELMKIFSAIMRKSE